MESISYIKDPFHKNSRCSEGNYEIKEQLNK